MWKRRVVVCLLLLLVRAGESAAAPVGRQWWRGDWAVRVPLELPSRPGKPKWPGPDVAVVECVTAGLLQPDGRDLRVVADGGNVTPHRVLQVGPGDRVRFAFAVVPGRKQYDAYFGNPGAKAPAGKDAKLDLRRGVLLEVWKYAGGQARTFPEAVATVNQSAKHKPIGRGFRKRVFTGHNPFGPEDRVAAVYTAWLIAPTDGRYGFGSCSRNASFVVVDDTVVVHNGGWHGPRRRHWPTGSIELKGGLHRLTYYHVTPWAHPHAVLSWKPPGGTWHVVEPASFAPVLRAETGPLERRGKPVAVDFDVAERGETFLGDRYAQRRVFGPSIAGRGGQGLRWQWSFGDGQQKTTKGPEPVEHVYLSPGERKVTLRVSGHSAPLEIVHRIEIDRDWDRVTSPKLDPPKQYAQIVAGYDLSKLPAGDLAVAVKLFHRTKDLRNLLRSAKAFADAERATPEEIRTVAEVMVPLLRAGEKSDQAVKLLAKAVGMTRHGPTRAELLIRAGQIRLDDLGDEDGAMQLFQRVLREHGRDGGEGLRTARIAVGDVWRARGELDKARQAYRQADVTDKRARKFPAIVQGDFARQAEAYLRRGDHAAALDALDAWEQTLPTDRLEGYSTLLRVRVLAALGRHAEAVREATVLVEVNPASQYAPNLLLARAMSQVALKQPDRAVASLRKLVRNYPESVLAIEAATLLRSLKPDR